MKKLNYLKSALVGGASVLALAHSSVAKEFDIPRGDLAAALNAYMQQAGVQIVYSDDIVRGHRSKGARGEYTEIAALMAVLNGSGLTAQMMHSELIGIVPQKPASVKQLAQAARRAPAVSAPAAPAASGIETVVVTAQKKKEDIQQVPIAVTALSQQQLTERQIAGGPDLVKEVPNLTFSKTNFTGYNLEIRGIGTQAISVTTDPAVAVAFNDIPFIRNHFFEQEFYDLADVEVLRGPQGTLYGRNATAGVVDIKSALPTDSYEAMLSADLGNYSNRRLEGMLNLPIIGDTLDLRIAGEWTKRDGYSFNTTTDQPIDGRDLWSGRATLAWKPASNVQTYLVWEHFSEDDDRLRSGKQLCKTAPTPSEIDGVSVENGNGFISQDDFLSQGCEDTSLYSPGAFEVPNGNSLAYYAPLAPAGAPTRSDFFFDVYGSTTQSTNLRDIESTINPTYRAKNDTLEWNTDWQIDRALTLVSQTGYNNDFLWSTEDYNRFDSTPGAFAYDSMNNGDNGRLTLDPNGLGICQYAPGGACTTLGQVCPDSANGCSPDGIFCDPQLGCSDRLVAEDLSDERSWQFSQEFRLASDFDGPFNFSFGANYLHYETEENYYVFINSLTLFSTSEVGSSAWIPGVSDDSFCLSGAEKTSTPQNTGSVLLCHYIDPNPIASLNNEGHNYFLSQNPYLLNSYAGFGEVYYNLAKDLKLTAGARWTDDQKQFIDIPSELLTTGYGYPITGVVDQQWDRWTGRFVTDWTPDLSFTDQTLVYFSAAHGYKAGGANPPGALFPGIIGGGIGALSEPIHPLTFKPEYIEAFELGSKNTALDGALTVDGDIFYYNYTGYQISEIVDRTAINNNYNAHVEGAELETNWEPLSGLKFGFEGGFEDTTLAGGDESIDLMDRTAGNPNWMVVKPFVTEASNCVLPTYVVAAFLESGYGLLDACNYAYFDHVDPVTNLPYAPNPAVTGPGGFPIPHGYPGFDPVSPTATNPDPYLGTNAGPAPNNGEGFDKQLGGNQLPTAPHFTTSLTAEYTMPVSDDWAATFHTDFYWQSQSWARVFEDPIDKLHGYSNVNVSLILTSANGWQVMGYVKNVFNVTAITGTFLNSDDSGLTTNVFLTDPRLIGIRVTKQLDQADGFWGSEYSGADFFTNLFSDTDNGKPPLWIELGGSFSNLSDARQTFDPAFLSAYAPNDLKSPLFVEHAPHYGFDEEATVSFQPNAGDWIFSAGIRYGRSAANAKQHQQFANPGDPVAIPASHSIVSRPIYYTFYPTHHQKFADALAHQSETHSIMDFMVGKDVGLGLFGLDGSSIVSGGIRVAQFVSKSNINFNAEPDVNYPTAPITDFSEKYKLNHQANIRFHNYSALASDKESFHGLGPKLDWKASTPVIGDEADGEVAVDWGANFAVLFGRQKAGGSHQTTTKSYYASYFKRHVGGLNTGHRFKNPYNGYFMNKNFCTAPVSGGCQGFGNIIPTHQATNIRTHNRSRMVAVPNLGAFVGLSMKYNNAKVSFGYRADEFFGAMDGGIDTYKSYNRGFFGPFASISIGLGG
jgi:iron complex outermembrane receptor protein